MRVSRFPAAEVEVCHMWFVFVGVVHVLNATEPETNDNARFELFVWYIRHAFTRVLAGVERRVQAKLFRRRVPRRLRRYLRIAGEKTTHTSCPPEPLPRGEDHFDPTTSAARRRLLGWRRAASTVQTRQQGTTITALMPRRHLHWSGREPPGFSDSQSTVRWPESLMPIWGGRW